MKRCETCHSVVMCICFNMHCQLVLIWVEFVLNRVNMISKEISLCNTCNGDFSISGPELVHDIQYGNRSQLSNKKPEGFMQSCCMWLKFAIILFTCLNQFILYFCKGSTSMAFTYHWPLALILYRSKFRFI